MERRGGTSVMGRMARLAAVAVLSTIALHADVTYTYTGPHLVASQIYNYDPPFGTTYKPCPLPCLGLTAANFQTVKLTFPAPLPADPANGTVIIGSTVEPDNATLSAWELTDGVHTISSASGGVLEAMVLEIIGGKFVGWDISAHNSEIGIEVTSNTVASGGKVTSPPDSPYYTSYHPGVPEVFTYVFTDPCLPCRPINDVFGTWSGPSPTPTAGTISVTTNLSSAMFSITGPATYSGSGTSLAISNAPSGQYTITYGAVAGYNTPTSQTQTLAAGGTITFTATYITPSCASIIGIAARAVRHWPGVPYSSDGKPRSMNALFAPTGTNGSLMTIADAKAACNFTDFNWQQTVEVAPNPNPITVCNPSGFQGLCAYARSDPNQPLVSPFSDPPKGGYYFVGKPVSDPFPFYLDSVVLSTYKTPYTLTFFDNPTDPVLNPLIQAAYNFQPTATADKYTTSLVGMLACGGGGQPVCGTSGAASPPLFTWTWQSTYNGTSGSVRELQNLGPLDTGSGTGGITITSINGVQLPPVVSPSQVTTTASGLAYSRVSRTFNGTVTVKNISSSVISGPMQIVYFGMPVNVTLVNATSNLSGTPYMTVPAVTTLSPGQSVTVSVQFKNPSNETINFTPVIYSGSLN
ncbi:MAG: hypothetical protein NTW28_34990 [Candidatus Solibacter sp.]|nr:hypothetical protein [Candidatus Solibacter sp.]